MKKIIIFITLLFIWTIIGQDYERKAGGPFQHLTPFYSEINIVPGDSLNTYYYIYKLPYNNLFFIKNGDNYNGGFKLNLEVYDTSKQFIERQIKLSNVSVNEFSKTNSPENFIEGMAVFKLPNKAYNFLPDIIDLHSNQEARPAPLKTKSLSNSKTEFPQPIVIYDNILSINDINYRVLANFNGSIPFGNRQFELMIPVADTTINKIYITAVNNNDTVFSGNIKESYVASINIFEKENHILIKNDDVGKKFRIFIFKDFVNKLDEGKLMLTISDIEKSIHSENYSYGVVWFDKPFILRNPELAIKMLKFMVSDSEITKLLDTDNTNYSRNLTKFWKKYDPTPDTRYNELEDEYYKRVNYAIRNFAAIGIKNGVDTDRGKIFIKFGEPDKIERSSDNLGRVTEKWLYEDKNLSFIFIDRNGTGEFPLLKG